MSFLFDAPSKDEKLMYGVVNSTAKFLEKKYSMTFAGNGVGMDLQNKFDSCMISFQMYHPMTKDQCRATIIDCANHLLANINNNVMLRQYLANYPFTYNNIEVTILMSYPDREIYHPEIGSVSINHDEGISYATEDPENRYRYKTRVVESYDDAFKQLATPNNNPNNQ